MSIALSVDSSISPKVFYKFMVMYAFPSATHHGNKIHKNLIPLVSETSSGNSHFNVWYGLKGDVQVWVSNHVMK